MMIQLLLAGSWSQTIQRQKQVYDMASETLPTGKVFEW